MFRVYLFLPIREAQEKSAARTMDANLQKHSLKSKLLESIAAAFSLRWQDSLLPINYLGKRRAETAKKPSEFDLSFYGPRNGPVSSSGKTVRPFTWDKSLLPFLRIPPVPCRLETRGVNGEIAGERE